MANEIVKSESNQIEKVTEQTLISHLENLGLMKDLTKGEKDTYLQICKAYNLNPFKREIHVSKYNGQMSIITGYETYIKRAERSGLLDGWEVKTEGTVKDNTLKAIITIYRKDRTRPFVWEALYNEYVQRNSSGAPNKFWQKAETMTKKVAMAQGFRLCFNDELGGMPYTADEMGQDPITYDVKNEEVKPITAAIALPKITDKALGKAIERIAAGESELVAKIKTNYALTDEQLQVLETASVIVAEKVEGAILIS